MTLRPGVKWRDRLTAAALKLANDPTQTLAFHQVADDIIAAVQNDTRRQAASMRQLPHRAFSPFSAQGVSMPHANPKVNQMEQDTIAALAHHKKHGKKGAHLDRNAVEAAAKSIIANLRAAVVAGQPTLNDSIDHTDASLNAILDAVEAAS